MKSKAAAVNMEREKTGGGPNDAPQLTPVEERLMGVMGWRSVAGLGRNYHVLDTLEQCS